MSPSTSPESSTKEPRRISLDELFGDSYLRLTQKIRAGEYVSPERIANARRDYSDQTPPPEFAEYAERLVRGEIGKPRGPKQPQGVRLLFLALFRLHMEEHVDRYHAWLRARKKRFGPRGWPSIREADWWQGPPVERAYRMAMARVLRKRTRPLYFKHLNRFPFAWNRARDICRGYRSEKNYTTVFDQEL